MAVRTAASALVRDEAGRVLLVLRGRGPNTGRWSLPGGKSEAGETPETTVVREVREETGLIIAAQGELTVLPVETPGTTYEIHVFHATVLAGKLAAGDDAADAVWLTEAQLARLPLTSGLLELVERPSPTAGNGPGSVGTVSEPTMREKLHAALSDAMREQDRIATSAYRSALAALDDQADPQQQRSTVGAVMAEHRRAADDFAGDGRPVDANRAWAQADLLQDLLGG